MILFVSECWAQLHVRFHLTKLGKNFHRKNNGENPDLGWLGTQPMIMKLPPSWGDKMDNVRKRKTHWGEAWARTDVAVLWGQTGQASMETRSAALQIHRALAVTASNMHSSWWIKLDCTNCCYKGPNSTGTLGHLTDPFHHLQPSVEPKFCLPRSTFSSVQQGASTVFSAHSMPLLIGLV